MKSLLYIGNKLSNHGNTATGIEMLGPLLEKGGFSVRYASTKKSKLLRFADMLWTTIRYRNKTDYILIDTYSTQNFWYAVSVGWLCRIFKLEYIPILHGGNLPSRLKSNPKLCRGLFGNAFVNVAPSGYLLEAFTAAGFKTHYIPNPFDVTDFPHHVRTEINPKLLWVRSFTPIYNPEMALDVLSILKTRFPDASLCMVGPDKGIMEKTKRLAEAKYLDVTYTGKLSKPEWATLSKSYDIFINTSRIDNAPFSIIEAAALGMAIVSTNVGGIPYLLKSRETALLVADGDANAMADAVSELITNKDLTAHLLKESRQLATQRNSQSVIKKWIEILI